MSWDNVPLSDAYWFQEGPGIRNWQFTSSGIKLLNVGNIEKNGRINLAKTDRHISLDEAHGKYKHFLCDEGDLVIASSGISFDEDGYLRTRGAFIEKIHMPLCINTSTIRFKSINGNDLGYLKHWLQSVEFRRQITKLVTGSAQLNFGPSHLKQLKISIPPLAEQKRIAEILDKAAAIKAKREQAIAKLDELAQSTFLEMFGDPRNNEKKFPLNKIGDLVSEFRGGAALKPEDFVEAGFPILHKGAIKKNGNVIVDDGKKTFATNEYAASKTANIIDRGYLAVTLRDLVPSGPSIGLVASVEHGAYDEYLLAQGAYGFKIDKAKLNPEYFIQLSNMPNFRHVLRQFAVGSTQIHIRTPVYQNIKVPVPPIKLQNEFGELMQKQRLIRAELMNGLVKHSKLAVALQHQAFTTGFNA